MPTLNLLEEKITNLQNSLIELQTQTAFMENTIDVLNDIVTNQSQQLADQQRMLQLLYQKLNALPMIAKFSRLTCSQINHRIISHKKTN